ncbi:MAG: hypothetical protein NTZ47_05175, partial [Bacteroidetes bacterium]|nr:hypothetical protein [Bacteroidota bacterium]
MHTIHKNITAPDKIQSPKPNMKNIDCPSDLAIGLGVRLCHVLITPACGVFKLLSIFDVKKLFDGVSKKLTLSN